MFQTLHRASALGFWGFCQGLLIRVFGVSHFRDSVRPISIRYCGLFVFSIRYASSYICFISCFCFDLCSCFDLLVDICYFTVFCVSLTVLRQLC